MTTTYTPAAAIQSIANIAAAAIAQMPSAGNNYAHTLACVAIVEIQQRIDETGKPTKAPQQLELLNDTERRHIINALQYSASSPHRHHNTRQELLALITRLES